MKNPKRPYLSLCVIYRNNEDTIQTLLRSTHLQFDELVFCDTGCTDSTRKQIETYLKANTKTTQSKHIKFPWVNDFAKARQASFEAASGEWRMFLDTDDRLTFDKGVYTLRDVFRAAEKKHPDMSAVQILYRFSELESLWTTRACRWDAGWSWEHAVHENLVSLEDNPVVLRLKDVGVAHKFKTQEELLESVARNAAIAEASYHQLPPGHERGRMAFTTAQGYAVDDPDKAAEWNMLAYADLGGNHVWPETQRSAAKVWRYYYYNKEDKETARKWVEPAGACYKALSALGDGDLLKARHQAALAMADRNLLAGDVIMLERGVLPLEIAKTFAEEGEPLKAEACLNAIPEGIRKAPGLRALVDEVRNKIDRITILIPTGQQIPFDDGSLGTMLGGSEEAVVLLSRHLSMLGRNVRVYGVLPFYNPPHTDDFGVEWCHSKDFKLGDEHGCLVIWRDGSTLFDVVEQIARRQINKDPVVGVDQISYWKHDCTIPGNDAKTNTKLLKLINSTVVLSNHHGQVVTDALEEPVQTMHVIGNGVELTDFSDPDAWPERDRNKVVYSSDPSRGLDVLLNIWPEVHAAVPDATLDIYYDWTFVRRTHRELLTQIDEALVRLAGMGVRYIGGVGHKELHNALERCNVWAYSHFQNTQVETFCISAVKAQVAGATVLTTEYGALPEVVPEAERHIMIEDYKHALIRHLKNPVGNEARKALAHRAADRWSWSEVAKKFSDLWSANPPKFQLDKFEEAK
jgi:glycosyltransferase involved in cell wall biosynthesis